MASMAAQDAQLRQTRPQPLPAEPPRRQQVRSYPVFDRWTAHPGKKLTIAKINQAFRLAEDGWPETQCDLFDDKIEVDGHLRAVLDSRRDAVAGKDWIVRPGGDAEVDKFAASELERALKRVPNITETYEHQLSSVGYGYAMSEIVWERAGGLFKGVPLAVPVWFDNVAKRRFQFGDRDEPLLLQPNKSEGERLRPGKWWVTTRAGRLAARAGLMRTAIWWSHFKTMGFRDWMVLANRFGIPYVYAQYEDPIDDEEKEAAKQAVRMLGSDGWAIFSNAIEIKIAEMTKTGGSGELHDRLISVCNTEISKLIDGTTLGIETPSTYGSYAASRETGGRTFELRVGDANRLARSFATKVGRMFVEFNNIPAEPPRLLFRLVRDDNPLVRGQVFDLARNKLGMRLDEDEVRNDLQIKAVTGNAIEPPAAAPMQQPTPRQSEPEQYDFAPADDLAGQGEVRDFLNEFGREEDDDASDE